MGKNSNASNTSFVIIFDELSNALLLFSLRPIGAEIDGGIRPPPPPVGGGKSGVPVERRLIIRLYYNLHSVYSQYDHKSFQNMFHFAKNYFFLNCVTFAKNLVNFCSVTESESTQSEKPRVGHNPGHM